MDATHTEHTQRTTRQHLSNLDRGTDVHISHLNMQIGHVTQASAYRQGCQGDKTLTN